ncbi:MAG: hypothetical protein HY645_13830 [Acidobacteria bacterium]|nr:hypothetical protein [Acidobacteriota bacterium]
MRRPKNLSQIPINPLSLEPILSYFGQQWLDPNSRPSLFSPQLGVGPSLFTHISLINTGTEAATLTLSAFGAADPSAESRSNWVPHPRAGQPQATRTLAAGQKITLNAADVFGFPATEETLAGWIQVESSGAGVVGFVSFGDPQGRFLATVPLMGEPLTSALFSHVAEGFSFFTGLTVLNPSSSATAKVTLEVFTPDGVSKGVVQFDLSPRARTARLLREFFSDAGKTLGPQAGGFIQLTSSSGVFAFELFGNDRLDVLSAVPPQPIQEEYVPPPEIY